LTFEYAQKLPETLKALVDSLRFDPFYVAISQNFGDDEVTQSMELDAGFERLAPTLSAKGAEKGGAPALCHGRPKNLGRSCFASPR